MSLIPVYYNHRSLWARKVTTVASLIGIALVVFVFCTVLMLAHGVETTLTATGHPNNAMVLRKGAQAEIQSVVTREIKDILSAAPEVTSDGGGPLFSPELVVLLVLDRRDGEGGSNVAVRGVGARALAVHNQVKVAEGRMFEHGKGEVIVGRKLAARFVGTRLGETVKLGRREWKVVGVIEAGGSAFESEIWGDVEDLMPAFQRTMFSSVTARLKAGGFDTYKARALGDPRMDVDVMPEVQYYRDQSKGLALFVRILGLFVAIVFSLGAMIGAMITMYAQVAARVREVGTLRALGFQRRAVLAGFVIESLMLALVGGAAGIALASLMQLASFSTMNFASFSEVVFRFDLSGGIVLASLVFATLIGIFGGLAPAARAARLRIVDVIRA
ncbi:MAG TPA: ABC transporter permease [Polyangia bacterium]|nr:ABC transporter permease [Polyangia bacterium]